MVNLSTGATYQFDIVDKDLILVNSTFETPSKSQLAKITTPEGILNYGIEHRIISVRFGETFKLLVNEQAYTITRSAEALAVAVANSDYAHDEKKRILLYLTMIYNSALDYNQTNPQEPSATSTSGFPLCLALATAASAIQFEQTGESPGSDEAYIIWNLIFQNNLEIYC